MRRRSRAGGERAKSQRHKAVTPKRRSAPESVSARGSSVPGQETEVTQLTRELNEARQQQVATADVLKVISCSSTDVKPVFDMIAESARRLCDGQFCFVYRFDGQLLHFVAHHSLTAEVLEMNRRAYPAPPSRKSAAARAILERGFVQIPDTNAEPDYALGAMAVVGKYRSVVAVPIIRDDLAIGSIAVARAQAGLLPDPQVELLKTFADQAAIAIENVRLFDEVQARTHEVQESLEYQTAISEVLDVISRSPSDIRPVLNTIAETAQKLCQSEHVFIFRLEGGRYHLAASRDVSPEQIKWLTENPITPDRGAITGRTALERRPVQVVDVLADPEYVLDRAGHKGFRTVLGVPLLRDDVAIGVIALSRSIVKPFTDKQVELVSTFADQAVIAIENVRLFEAEQQRTRELTESLEQQTATSEVLKVISGSPGDLQPVFDAMLANATRLCEAKFGTLQLRESDSTFRVAAMHNPPPVYAEARRRNPLIYPSAHSALGRVIATKQLVHIADYTQDVAYKQRDPLAVSIVELAGARTLIIIPMLKEGELIGNLLLYRQEVRPFTEKQIALLTNFAAQAVIAIENTRLLNELRQRTDDLTESLQQQTATSEILDVISNSPGDLQPVFDAILANATDLCGAGFASLRLSEGDQFRTVSLYNAPAALVEHWRSTPLVRPHPESALGRAALTKQVVEIDGVREAPAYSKRDPIAVAAADLGGYRTVLAVPMLREDVLVGAISIYRQEVRPFTDKQIELVKNFASQ